MGKHICTFWTKIAADTRKLGRSLLLCGIILFALWIRIQMVAHIPEGQFLGNDPYLYYWQAGRIAEHGSLPDRDMHRWLPLGRDNGQTLNLYSYVLAYTHKAVAAVFRNVTLYQVCTYMPVACFCIGLALLFLFLYGTHGLLFASIVGLLLATFPGSISRSTAGFGDRDAFCLMLGILSIITYLQSHRVETQRKRLVWTLASGVLVCFGGFSWEGFGVFVSLILVVEIWRFLSSDTEEGLGRYTLWVCCFVPALYLVSPAYRNGYGFAEHLFAFMLVPPVVLLGIRAFHQFLMAKVKRLHRHGRTVALVLTLAGVGIALSYTLMQLETFASTTVPLSRNRLMRSIGELHSPHYRDWVLRYGNLFLVGSIGLITAAVQLGGPHGMLFVLPTSLFILTTFFQDPLHRLLGTWHTYTLFFGALAAVPLIGLTVAYRKRTQAKNEILTVAFATWFVLWLTLARDAVRYDFFVGIPIAYFSAHVLHSLSKTVTEKVRCSEYTTEKFRRSVPHARLRIGIALFIFAVLLSWVPPGKHAERFHFATTHIRRTLPDNPHLKRTFEWMKTQIPSTVVAASWNDGSQLNVLGGVKTILDQDHYIQHWIHLYNRHVFCARSHQEALSFLKTHEATHLLLIANEIIYQANSYSNIGSDENGDIRWECTPLHRQVPKEMKYRMVPDVHADIPLESVEFDMIENTLTVKAVLKTGDTVDIPAVVLINKGRVTTENKNEHGGVLIIFDEYQQPTRAYYVPAIGWDSLAVRLYFRGDLPDIFVPVYPPDRAAAADVKIWEIYYPPDIQTDVKYLKTGFPEIDAVLQIQ